MKLYKTRSGIVVEYDGQFYRAPSDDWDALVNQDGLHHVLLRALPSFTTLPDGRRLVETELLAPIGQQEVWAAGVTYLRSRDARMDESRKAGGETGGGSAFYDRVYDADRPELFFKATAARVVGPGQPVCIRSDSSWNVPEPELTLFVTSGGNVVGYTIGNDMSSRSIEGENPLYLPQAKTYDGSAALGPCLYVPDAPIAPDTLIQLTIERSGDVVFDGRVAIRQMKRSHAELVGYLFRALRFPHGCYLMTGTGIVPPDHFTLAPADVVSIAIDGIGTLRNWVA